MQIDVKKDRKILLINAIICLLLVLLSFVGLFFNEYIVVLAMLVCGLVSVLSTFLLQKGGSGEIGTKFAIFTLLRYLLLIIGLLISAVLVYLTMGSEVNKLRYLIVAISAIQYLVSPIVLVVFSR